MSIIKSGIIIGFFTFLSRIFGFIRDIFITKELGASIYSDAFNIAFRLPNLFRRLFAEGAFNSAFVPIFTNKFKNDKDQALNFAGDAFTMLTVALVIITIICEIFIEELVYIIAPGFALNDINSLELTVALSRIALPYLLFISISSLFSSMLNSTHRFMIASIIPILLNVAMIISLLFFGDITKSKAHALIWGVFFGGILQVFVAFIGVRRAGLMPKVSKFQLSDDLKKLLKNMVPGIIGGGITQINLIVSQALASFLPVGGLSILAYSDRVCQLPLAVIGTAIGTVILPTLSRQLHAKEYVLANETQNRAVEAGFLLAMPAMIALVIMAKPIVFALFERGAFSHQDTILTANCLIAFSLGLIGYIMIKIFTPVFFAIYDTKTPVKISLISIIINFVLTIILMELYGAIGIAYATSVSSVVNAYILYICLKRKGLYKLDNKLKVAFVKILVSCAIMAVATSIFRYFFSPYLFHSNNLLRLISLLGLVFVGIVIYFAMIHYLKVLTLKEVRFMLKRN